MPAGRRRRAAPRPTGPTGRDILRRRRPEPSTWSTAPPPMQPRRSGNDKAWSSPDDRKGVASGYTGLAALRKGGRPTRQPPNRAGHHRRSLTGAWIEPQQALALRRLARFGPAALHVIDEGSQLRHYLPVAG